MIEEVQLTDGTPAWVAPLQRGDKERLAEEFRKLSPESRRLRFLTPITHLSDQMLTHLVDDVDWIDHIAFVLLVGSEEDPEPIAIARMVRYPTVPDAADLAVTVKDDWQGRGAASALLPVVMKHRPEGVTHLLTEVSADNPASLAMLARLGPVTTHDAGFGVYDVDVDLTGDGEVHPEADPSAERLHPVLAEAERLYFRTRDAMCSWLNA